MVYTHLPGTHHHPQDHGRRPCTARECPFTALAHEVAELTVTVAGVTVTVGRGVTVRHCWLGVTVRHCWSMGTGPSLLFGEGLSLFKGLFRSEKGRFILTVIPLFSD